MVAIRFQETYIHVPSIDWKKRLDTRAKYLDDLLAALSPADLARSLTRSDQTMFASLSREKFVSEQDPIVETLHTRWSDLAVSVRDCCTALPEFVPFIQDCIKVSKPPRQAVLSLSFSPISDDGRGTGGKRFFPVCATTIQH